MRIKDLSTLFAFLLVGLSACQSPKETCTVQGTVQGVNDGAQLELQDAWNKYKVIATTTVENGTFEFHPQFPKPTHVYLYASNEKDVYANPYDGGQLKDFILEPGTIVVDVDASDESDMGTGATGTALNDTYRKILAAEGDEKDALWEEAMRDGQTDLMTLLYAEHNLSSPAQAMEALDRLSPDLDKYYKSFATRLRKLCARRMKANESKKDTEQETDDGRVFPEYYIDMKYPDTDGKRVSLSSVVDNPANRYVILDFWATWCGPCVKSIPLLKEVYEQYHDLGLEIYSVSQDSKTKEWKSFVAENGMTWVNVLSWGGGPHKDYEIKVIPTVLLIDCKTGKILLRESHPDLKAVLSDLFDPDSQE